MLNCLADHLPFLFAAMANDAYELEIKEA